MFGDPKNPVRAGDLCGELNHPVADRVHVLNYGRTLASGSAEAVLKDPRVVEAYLGKAAP